MTAEELPDDHAGFISVPNGVLLFTFAIGLGAVTGCAALLVWIVTNLPFALVLAIAIIVGTGVFTAYTVTRRP